MTPAEHKRDRCDGPNPKSLAGGAYGSYGFVCHICHAPGCEAV
jgi:hypothetical protein